MFQYQWKAMETPSTFTNTVMRLGLDKVYVDDDVDTALVYDFRIKVGKFVPTTSIEIGWKWWKNARGTLMRHS